MFLLSYDKIYCMVGALASCDQNHMCTGKENMKTQMNTNIETLEYLDNKGVTETLYEETAQVPEKFYCTAFASIFSLNI